MAIPHALTFGLPVGEGMPLVARRDGRTIPEMPQARHTIPYCRGPRPPAVKAG
jgi:hypothetical protein